MSGIAQMFHDTVKSVTGKSPQEHADALKSVVGVPAAVNDADASKAVGAAPEPTGTTLTGGKRLRRKHLKTRKGGKRSRKATHRRRR